MAFQLVPKPLGKVTCAHVKFFAKLNASADDFIWKMDLCEEALSYDLEGICRPRLDKENQREKANEHGFK